MRARVIASVFVALALIGVGAATAEAKGPHASNVPIIQVVSDTSETNGAVGYAVRAWNAGATNVAFVKSNGCSGRLCVHVSAVDAHPAGTCGNIYGGCEWTYPPDETCYVTVTRNLADVNRDLIKAVTTHEVGHCAGMPHVDPAVDLLTIMAPNVGAYQPIMVPSAGDFALLNSLWADGYQAPY